jgi:hypothetical protein
MRSSSVVVVDVVVSVPLLSKNEERYTLRCVRLQCFVAGFPNISLVMSQSRSIW